MENCFNHQATKKDSTCKYCGKDFCAQCLVGCLSILTQLTSTKAETFSLANDLSIRALASLL